jgi:hypothetical protein
MHAEGVSKFDLSWDVMRLGRLSAPHEHEGLSSVVFPVNESSKVRHAVDDFHLDQSLVVCRVVIRIPVEQLHLFHVVVQVLEAFGELAVQVLFATGVKLWKVLRHDCLQEIQVRHAKAIEQGKITAAVIGLRKTKKLCQHLDLFLVSKLTGNKVFLIEKPVWKVDVAQLVRFREPSLDNFDKSITAPLPKPCCLKHF